MTSESPSLHRPSFWARVRRWFSWRRKRFWLITLPVGIVAAMIATLAILFSIPGLTRHEWKIGSWTIAAVDGWYVLPDRANYAELDSFSGAPEVRELWQRKAARELGLIDLPEWARGRSVRVGPFAMSAVYYPSRDDVAARLWRESILYPSRASRGLAWLSNETMDGHGIQCRMEHWDLDFTYGADPERNAQLRYLK